MASDLTKKLPNQVLAHIFFHLDPLGKVAASSACKRWMDISKDYPDLLDDVCVYFTEHAQTLGPEVFSTMTRNFHCFCFDGVLIDLNILHFLQKLGPKFRSLSFKYNKVIIDLENPSHTISNLDNLLELRMFCSQVERMFSYLPKLTSLHLNTLNMFYLWDIHYVDTIIPLSLTDFKIDALYPPSTYPLEVYRHPDVRDFILKRYSTLMSLDLKGMPLSDEEIASLLKVQCLRLKCLKLPCYFPLVKTFQTFSTSQREIVALDLERVDLEDSNIVMICNALPQLEELNVSFCKGINKSVVQIFQLKCLKRLNLSGCRCIKKSFQKAIGKLACKELEFLELEYMEIDSLILTELLSLLPNLRKIALSEEYGLHSRWIKCAKTGHNKTRKFLYQRSL